MLAGMSGFDRFACADIETAVSEIASNALRHADGGWAAIRLLDNRFEVVVTDRGPRTSSPRRSSGLGIGLEGAGRLMTSLTFTSLQGGSTVTMWRERPQPAATPGTSQWSVTAVYRAKSGNTTTGDVSEICELSDGSIRVALADGLGSGVMAASAARRVLDEMDLRLHQAPSEALATADASTRDTRGAAVSAVFLAGDGSGLHAGLGDVTCQTTMPAQRLANRPGIVGTGNGSPADTPFRVGVNGAVLMWTDGLAVTEDQLRPLGSATSEIECMEQIVMSHSDRHDDAAFLMVRKVR
jgi:hypothetical protein